MKQLFFILTFFAALFPFTARAASTTPYALLSVPTSPQAAAFKMYGDVAVNPAMGVPDVSIPLFDIDHHGYRLPLSLKYNPAPFHPGYNYDVFGRGWALSVSSCISRSIECMPDEIKDFKLDIDQFGKLYRNITEETLSILNLKSDLFTATLPDGSSFDFVIRKNYDGKIEYVVSGGRDVKITHIKDTDKIISFKVVDEQGIEYTFTGADTTFTGPGCTITPYGITYVSWQLTSICLPHSAELITFSYEKSIRSDHGYQQAEAAVRFQHFYGTAGSFDVTSHTYTRQHAYQMKLLTSVSYGTTTIRINYKDGTNSEYYNYAQSISTKDGDRLVRTINLEQHQGTLYHGLGNMPFSTLDSITLLGSNDTSSETYQCGYTSSYASFGGTDHWGNLNFRSSNYDVAGMNLFVEFDVSSKAPFYVIDVPKDENDLSPLDKVRLSDSYSNTRAPASPKSHCVLNKLTYPTGGYTEFYFENHEFFSLTDADGDYIHDKKKREKTQATGFRIREIVNYTAEGVRSDSKHYCYGQTDYEANGGIGGRYFHTGAGEPTVDPTIETYMSYQSSTPIPMSVLNMVLGLDPDGNYRSFYYNPFTSYDPSAGDPINKWEWECTFSAFNFQRLLNGRPAVVYPEVTVYYLKDGATLFTPENCNGKTVYQYDIYEETQYDTAFFEKPQYFRNVLSYVGERYRYNLLKEQDDYMSDGQEYKLKRRETLIWRSSGASVAGWEYSNVYGTLSFVPSTAIIGDFYTSTWQLLGHSLLYERKVNTYDDSGTGITETEQYSYLSGNRIKWKKYNAGGLQRETNWEYPALAEIGTTPDIGRKMVEKHILSPVLTEKQSNSDGYKREFGEFPTESGDTMILPARLYQTPSFQNILHSEVLAYSSNGNPREVVSKDKLHTVYLWGYGDRYLIAEIKNATLTEVETAVSSVFGTTSSVLAKSATPDVAKLKALRNHTSLSKAHVTTFTHLPLVGVTSISDPTGKTSYYDYDGLGRLKTNYYYEGNVVEESKKRVVQEYDYHYRNQ